MVKHKKNNVSGITLIALVITIIILLILAGISVQMLTGDNGILNRAVDAKNKYDNSVYYEEAQMNIMEGKIEDVTNIPTEPSIYTINFNANGGEGTMQSMTISQGETKTLTANTFEKSGYAFIGWNTDSSATTAQYMDEENVSSLIPNNNTTIDLYAVWKEITALIPVMNDFTCQEGEVIYDSWYYDDRDDYVGDNFKAWKAFDGVLESSNYASGVGDFPHWLGFHFNTQKCVKKFEWYDRVIDDTRYCCPPGDYTFQASNDGNTWITLGTYSETTKGSGIYHLYELNNNNSYYYYRMHITSNVGGGYYGDATYVILDKFQMFGY